ncbi:hypothetical protein GCM10007880_61360 [Mesorhizobium amorphae]|uniref:hypothetical protein n=1 Tax=Mesorhizobium amorphae TaxID=71433 RepID=UPI00235B91F3|nr:hypothetical protein [Mesorhizobium amorphae]GLR45618.1 hypothetical protein GCM10007880_61360 [Mesorhizobium amorphae]
MAGDDRRNSSAQRPRDSGRETAAASLSAVLLDEDYCAFLKSMVRDAGGIPVLNAAAIIPSKARAWLDLSSERDAGEQG